MSDQTNEQKRTPDTTTDTIDPRFKKHIVNEIYQLVKDADTYQKSRDALLTELNTNEDYQDVLNDADYKICDFCNLAYHWGDYNNTNWCSVSEFEECLHWCGKELCKTTLVQCVSCDFYTCPKHRTGDNKTNWQCTTCETCVGGFDENNYE